MNRIVRTRPFLATLLLCGSVFVTVGAIAQAEDRALLPGIERLTLTSKSVPDAPAMRVWVYRPAESGAESLPCVLIAASGSNGLNGAALDDDQVAEHAPFVAEGFVVVAYDVDGAINKQTDPQRYQAMMKAFMQSEGGLANAREALRIARDAEPRIDVSRLFAAGHGSGANVALLLATKDERIRAVAAFSPLGDVAQRAGEPVLAAIDAALPGYAATLKKTQPLAVADQIKSRVMLFHPIDDEVSPVESSRTLADALRAAGNEPNLVEPNAGGHVEAMMNSGLQQAATWLAEMARRMPASKPTTRPG